MTGDGDNDTPVQSQSVRIKDAPQAMRAAGGDPRGGETPVEQMRRLPPDGSQYYTSDFRQFGSGEKI